MMTNGKMKQTQRGHECPISTGAMVKAKEMRGEDYKRAKEETVSEIKGEDKKTVAELKGEDKKAD
jgi:hypothetical protein